MPRWSAVGGDAGVLRFEARTRLVGWVDDVTIEVGEDGGGSRLEIRSASRVGLSDFWANSLRIRAFFRALDSAIRAS
ncbi:DUF1499 domain-containing protein [bacterium]|nr:DUF1499 domain-containing protein [bacterium]